MCGTLRLSHISHCYDYIIQFDVTEYNQPGINTLNTITITIHCSLEHLSPCFNVLHLPKPSIFRLMIMDIGWSATPLDIRKTPRSNRRREAGYHD